MKLRIRGNSVRLRLLQSEVAELEKSGSYSESTSFGGGRELRYTITSGETQTVSATFEDSELKVLVPKDVLNEWLSTELVGFEGKTGDLSILVEKDFVCLTRTDDPDNLDAFPNPDESSC